MKRLFSHQLIRQFLLTAAVFIVCILICHLLSLIHSDNNPFAVPIFILGVALISRLTSGYLWGIAASILGVVCVNYMFTYPFWEFDLTLSGYPLTFTVMLLVSLIVSTLTTQVKRQQQMMYDAQSESMRANLLRAISHDIRTPLASILGSSSALLEQKEMAEQDRDELLRSIAKDARWLTRVTENLLSVTKFSTEGVRLHLTEEVVEEIVGSAIHKFRKTDPAIAIQVERPDEILLVPMEATLIEQVLLNLLENVVHHGGGATKITLQFDEEDGRICFRVRDNGRGIDPARLPYLFDGSLLGQDGRGNDGRRNMGIGLSVCHTIIAAHGGEMSARNPDDGGAEILFWLPMTQTM
ncbi:MAG: DUF4118 domain-containing protein [Ruminococcaceae bacterium]|nr:DUF4118 domain-containing protein [Oscillospiraceae bacterium]